MTEQCRLQAAEIRRLRDKVEEASVARDGVLVWRVHGVKVAGTQVYLNITKIAKTVIGHGPALRLKLYKIPCQEARRFEGWMQPTKIWKFIGIKTFLF